MKIKTYCVYIHTTPSNKAYIGITSQKPGERWKKGEGYSTQPHFYSAIKKYGWDNIKHIIFADGLSQEEAFRLEKQLIALFNTTNPKYGYNKSLGGELGTSKTVYCVEKDKFYPSLAAAAKENNVNYSSLCMNMDKPHQGLHFAYIRPDEKQEFYLYYEFLTDEVISTIEMTDELSLLLFGEI